MDALSAALNSVRMTGAIFYHAVCTAPWGFAVPPIQRVAHLLAPGTERLIGYHLVTEGHALCRFEDGTEVLLEAGDVVIIPHGDAHTVTNGSPATLLDSEASLGSYLAGDLHSMQLGGGGEVTHFICGYFGCEQHADRLFLAGLPRVVKINVRSDAAGEWLESSIQHLVTETGSERPGKVALLSKMAEALFIETLRRYMEQLPPAQTGWLAAARDRSSAAPWHCCTGEPVIPGRSQGWRANSRRHARSWRSVSPVCWANRRFDILLAGGCSLRQDCCGPAEGRSCRLRWTSATSPKRRSTAHSSVNSGCPPASFASRASISRRSGNAVPRISRAGKEMSKESIRVE